MKLQKFRKNGKQKGIAIGCLIVLLITIAGVNLYRTFALYKEEKTFNVLRGVVPDFSKNRETPYNEQLNGADPVLDSAGTLIPVIVDPDTGVVKKADPEKEWYNYEKKQWANAIIPTSSAKSTVQGYSAGTTISESYIQSYFVWIPKYSYQIQTTGTSSSYKAKEFDIVFGAENTNDNNENECTTPVISETSKTNGNCKANDYMTHPAFTAFGDVKGLWVGKFETGHKDNALTYKTEKTGYSKNDLSDILIKSNQYAWTYTNVATMHQLAFNYQRELDSHLMKDTEWGAVAYLTQSIYGRCTKGEDENTTCEEVTINNNRNMITGFAGSSVSQTSVASNPNTDTEGTYNYKNPKSVKASTTGNYTGIYDMSGGTPEIIFRILNGGKYGPYIGSNSGERYEYLIDASGETKVSVKYNVSSGFEGSGFSYMPSYEVGSRICYSVTEVRESGVSLPSESKYYDLDCMSCLGRGYSETKDWFSDERGVEWKLGDPCKGVSFGHWVIRGSGYSDGEGAGLFSWSASQGDGGVTSNGDGAVRTEETFTFRIVLAPL